MANSFTQLFKKAKQNPETVQTILGKAALYIPHPSDDNQIIKARMSIIEITKVAAVSFGSEGVMVYGDTAHKQNPINTNNTKKRSQRIAYRLK